MENFLSWKPENYGLSLAKINKCMTEQGYILSFKGNVQLLSVYGHVHLQYDTLTVRYVPQCTEFMENALKCMEVMH